MTWRHARVAIDGTHHVLDGTPIYEQRFDVVMAFHEPGLAPVRRDGVAWHIRGDASTGYGRRFLGTFGFYERIATVFDESGWLHIRPDGTELTTHRYDWAGNFQNGRCTVRDTGGSYHHVNEEGEPAYAGKWRYAGDYRGGIAVAQRDDGLSSHIDRSGDLMHDRWFLDLDVFHKGLARARDERGWTHVDRSGAPVSERRFAMVEPFYNGQARVETEGGELLVIDGRGHTARVLRPPRVSPLQRLSSQMVGFWSTQTIRAAVEFGVLDPLPSSTQACASASGLSPPLAARLLRALWELRLVERRGDVWHATETGRLLRHGDKDSAADAALVWGREHSVAWGSVVDTLRHGRSAFETVFGEPFFDWLSERQDDRELYHGAMRAYAEHDYADIAHAFVLDGVDHIVDAGGGTGALLTSLLLANESSRGTLLERPDVVDLVSPPAEIVDRVNVLACDLRLPWPCGGDLIVLSRVVHDWDDDGARRILTRARDALAPGGRIALVEIVLTDDDPAGGLLDVNMLVMCGSRERTRQDWDALVNPCDLAITSVTPLPTYGSLIMLESDDAVDG